MSFKEWVVFVIGCLALGAGLVFGQGAVAANETASIMPSESIVYTVHSQN